MCKATKRTYHNDNIARSIDKPAKIWESMKEIVFDNCPVKKTKLALNVNEEVVTDETTIHVSPQQQHHYALNNTGSTRKTTTSIKPQPHFPSDQSHKEKLAILSKDLTTSQQTDEI
jgi:hypothetical protein